MSRRSKVNNCQPSVNQPHLPVTTNINSAIVRASMDDFIGHGFELPGSDRPFVKIYFSGYTAHLLSQ